MESRACRLGLLSYWGRVGVPLAISPSAQKTRRDFSRAHFSEYRETFKYICLIYLRMKILVVILGILMLSICLAGCTSQPATRTPVPTQLPVSTQPPMTFPVGVEWRLTSYLNGANVMTTVTGEKPVTAKFDSSGALSGSGGVAAKMVVDGEPVNAAGAYTKKMEVNPRRIEEHLSRQREAGGYVPQTLRAPDLPGQQQAVIAEAAVKTFVEPAEDADLYVWQRDNGNGRAGQGPNGEAKPSAHVDTGSTRGAGPGPSARSPSPGSVARSPSPGSVACSPT